MGLHKAILGYRLPLGRCERWMLFWNIIFSVLQCFPKRVFEFVAWFYKAARWEVDELWWDPRPPTRPKCGVNAKYHGTEPHQSAFAAFAFLQDPSLGQSLSPSPWVLATPSIPTNTDLPVLTLQGSTDLLHARSDAQLNPPNLQQTCWHLFYSCSLFLSIWEWRGDRRERCGVGSVATRRGGRDEPPPFSSMPLEFQSPPRFFCRKLLRWGEFPMLGIQRCGCSVWFGFFFCLCVRFPL